MNGSEPGSDTTASRPNQSASLAAATTAVQRATRLLLARQFSGGWWIRRPDGDICLDAEGLLLREFLGIRTAEQTSAATQKIRSLQRTDGSWAPAAGTADLDPGESLSASVLAYLALRLAGDSPDAYHMAVAAGWIRDSGGLDAAGVFARAWLACYGLTGWEDVHVPVPAVVYLPARRGAGTADWAGWSRFALVSVAVIGAVHPVRRLPFDVSALAMPGASARAPQSAGWRVPPVSPARSAALRRCGQWLVSWQERDGRDRSSPAWPQALLALHLLGYPLGHPVLAGGLAWLDSVTVRRRSASGPARPADPVPAPLRDTALAICALADAGLPGDHPAVAAAGTWLLARRLYGPADRHAAAPSGWSFGGDGYPAVPDTAEVLLALGRVRLPAGATQPAVKAVVRWLASMQARDGSWSRSPVTTAQVVRALAASGWPGSQVIRGGVVWLLRAQRPDGSWSGGPGETDLQATAIVLPALLAAGVLPIKPVIANAARWLMERQNLDAGWGTGQGRELATDRRGKSQAPATALVVAALLAAGGPAIGPAARDSVELGADWLVRAQQPDGGWGPRPRGRNARQVDSIVAGLLLPLSTLGRFVAASFAAQNGVAEDPPAGDRLAGDGRAGDGRAEDGPAGARLAGDRPTGDGPAGQRTAEDGVTHGLGAV